MKKKRIKRILSILCVLGLAVGCISSAALAEGTDTVRIVSVQWADEDDYDAKRPGSVDITTGGQTVTLDESNGWTAVINGPAGASWEPDKVDGYIVSISGTDLATVTYTHTVKKTAAATSVVWNDSDNAAGIRPDSVQVRLLADGKPYGAAKEASAKNGWSVAWENLPVTQRGKTDAIVYTAEEKEPEGYAVSVSGLTVTNTIQTGDLKLQVSVAAPEGADVSALSLTVTGPDPSMPAELTLGQLSGGTYDFGQVLPGAYVLQENNADSLVEGYEMDPSASKVGDAVVVKAGGSATLSFRYTYREPVAEEPNEDPMASAGSLVFEIDGPDPRMPVTVTYAQFTGGKYELDGLVPGTYYVIERNAESLVKAYTLTSDSVTGMCLTVGADGAAAVLINKYVPAPTPEPEAELISIPVTKTWNDDNNQDGNRPDAIIVLLFADGVQVDSRVVTEADGWMCTFADKPRFIDDGTEIKYTVDEETVAWYTPEINGYNITNNYQPEVTSATVTKVWNDKEDEQKIRPTTLAVTLLPIGKVFVLSSDNGWTVTAENLPTKINGEDVAYSWTEQETIGYVRESVVTSGIVTTFTNRITRIPPTPAGYKPPKTPGGDWAVFEEYRTALGIELVINHVGDCFD